MLLRVEMERGEGGKMGEKDMVMGVVLRKGGWGRGKMRGGLLGR